MTGAYDDALAGPVETLASSQQVTRLGAGALHGLGEAAEQAGMHNVLVVTDPAFRGTQAASVVMGSLQRSGIQAGAFFDVGSTPTVAQAEAAGKAAAPCDGIVSFGGGSAIDVAKGAAVVAGGGSLHGLAHGGGAGRILPHIACPTTAGTGSEQSHYAFFIDTEGHEHAIIEHAELTPVAAIIDPITHVSMPPHLSAATGINALSDAIEAYLSPAPTPSSDAAAIEAIQGIATALPRVHADGHDLGARTDMARAAYRAGQAFTEVGLGIVDSVSLVLSGMFSIGHSEANAIVLPHVMRYQSKWAGDRLPAIAQAMGASDAIAAVDALRHLAGVGETLADHGLGWDDVYLTANAILQHPFNVRDPHGLTAEGLAEVLVDAMGLDIAKPA